MFQHSRLFQTDHFSNQVTAFFKTSHVGSKTAVLGEWVVSARERADIARERQNVECCELELCRLTHEVSLAKFDATLPNDVVGGRCMEIEVWQGVAE